jgi:hypothetical protein
MFRSCIFGVLTGGMGLVSVMQAVAQQTCMPALAFKEVRFFRDAATNAGAKMDRSLVGRCVSLRDNFRTFRDRIFPIKGKRHRDRVPGAIHVEAGFSGNIGRFLALAATRTFFWARRRDELIDKNAIFTGG